MHTFVKGIHCYAAVYENLRGPQEAGEGVTQVALQQCGIRAAVHALPAALLKAGLQVSPAFSHYENQFQRAAAQRTPA